MFRLQKTLKFQSPKNAIFSVLGNKFEVKECVFHSRKCSFQFISHTINSYEKWTTMMKTKLHTFACKQVLRKPVTNFWKIEWNIAFTWLKHNVKPVGISEIIITFPFRLYDIFFVYNVIQTSCSFFL